MITQRKLKNVTKRIVSFVLAATILVASGAPSITAEAAATASGNGANYLASKPTYVAATGKYPARAFEKSLTGATGWVGKEVNLYSTYNSSTNSGSGLIKQLTRGTAFVITWWSTSSSYWKVKTESGQTGYVYWAYCMINLPDVLPNIAYTITNSTGAIYKTTLSSSATLSNITGVTNEKLYHCGKVYNSRLGYSEYLVPVMFKTACKISIAYYNIKSLGSAYNLHIYDAYRPHDVTTTIYENFKTFYDSKTASQQSNVTNGSTWNLRWFLAKSISSHNAGVAVDLTIMYNGADLTMPTAMHALTWRAAIYTNQNSTTWASTMNNAAKLLHYVMVGGSYTYGGKTITYKTTGLSVLKSEWWHFQDNSCFSDYTSVVTTDFYVESSDCMSY